MTRGKIIYIDRDGKIFSSVEFNGDMYLDGNRTISASREDDSQGIA